MPILATCPYCQEGQVRAPDQAAGLSATCPKCFNCFTIVASKELVKETAFAAKPAASKRSLPAPLAVPSSTAIALDQRPPTVSAPAATAIAPPPARPMPMIARMPPEDRDDAEHRGELSFIMALVGIILAGIGLGLSQFPYGRFATIVLTAIGLIVAGLGLLVAERGRLWPAIASIANIAAFLVVTLLPSWLGLDSWLPHAPAEDPKQVRAVAFVGSAASQPVGEGDWLDVTKGSWQRGDVRVTFSYINLTPVEIHGPKEKKKLTKEKYLVIGLNVRNSGVAREFNYRSWNEKPATPEAATVKLIDSKGNELKPATFEEGWTMPNRGNSGSLVPGKSLDDILVFEAPKEAIEQLKLELPFEAFGETAAPIRLLIPKMMNR